MGVADATVVLDGAIIDPCDRAGIIDQRELSGAVAGVGETAGCEPRWELLAHSVKNALETVLNTEVTEGLGQEQSLSSCLF